MCLIEICKKKLQLPMEPVWITGFCIIGCALLSCCFMRRQVILRRFTFADPRDNVDEANSSFMDQYIISDKYHPAIILH